MAAIETTQLTKRYGGATALADLDLHVEHGEVFGFLGPNGAGKSTTINLLLDFVRPSSGEARVLGYDTREESQAIRQHTGVLAEGIDLYSRLTGRRHVELAIDWAGGDDSPDALLTRVGMDGADADRKVGDYSKGMKQRIALAMALPGEPDLLILDEPATGLDPNGIRMMRELVAEAAGRGAAVFFSSHDLGQVEAACDRVGILDDGELVAVDTIDGLRAAVGASAELRLRLPSPPGIDVEAIEGITSATFRDGLLRITCEHPSTKATVVGQLLDADQAILDVDAESVSLEDVFAAYTNGEKPADRELRTTNEPAVPAPEVGQ